MLLFANKWISDFSVGAKNVVEFVSQYLKYIAFIISVSSVNVIVLPASSKVDFCFLDWVILL